jgi:hypothetical protein
MQFFAENISPHGFFCEPKLHTAFEMPIHDRSMSMRYIYIYIYNSLPCRSVGKGQRRKAEQQGRPRVCVSAADLALRSCCCRPGENAARAAVAAGLAWPMAIPIRPRACEGRRCLLGAFGSRRASVASRALWREGDPATAAIPRRDRNVPPARARRRRMAGRGAPRFLGCTRRRRRLAG